MTETLTLTDASERLGVHYMTAYRYVRTGRLAAVKDGGQWRVTVSDLESFEANDTPTQRVDVTPPRLVKRLMAGDENGSFQILESAMASGADAEEVYLELLGPAMHQIGEQWASGDISIADEHVASSTALRVTSRLGQRVDSRGRNRGTVLLASVSGDYHFLPTAMIRDLLRFRGFNVLDLGANTPAESIIDMANTIGDDLIAIGIAATNPDSDEIVRSTLATVNAELDLPIVVGGAAFSGAEHIQSLGTCIPSMSGSEVLDIFETIYTEARSR